jgi:hypothetical protein
VHQQRGNYCKGHYDSHNLLHMCVTD